MKKNVLSGFISSIVISGITILLFSFLCFGCRGKTPPVSFYTLSSGPEATNAMVSADSANDVRIGVGPVNLPGFLDTPRIVTRLGSSKLQYSEFHRWGGFLDEDFLRVMAENLSGRLSTDQVATYPFRNAFNPLYQVEFDVKRFDGEIQGAVTLNVIWQIRDLSEDERSTVVRRSIIREPVNASSVDDYESLVAAQSRVLDRLSAQIAEEIATY